MFQFMVHTPLCGAHNPGSSTTPSRILSEPLLAHTMPAQRQHLYIPGWFRTASSAEESTSLWITYHQSRLSQSIRRHQSYLPLFLGELLDPAVGSWHPPMASGESYQLAHQLELPNPAMYPRRCKPSARNNISHDVEFIISELLPQAGVITLPVRWPQSRSLHPSKSELLSSQHMMLVERLSSCTSHSPGPHHMLVDTRVVSHLHPCR